jgi:hypothetical protein
MTKEEEIDSEARYLKNLLEDKNMTRGESSFNTGRVFSYSRWF